MFWGGGILVSRIYNYTQGKYQKINNTKVAILVDGKERDEIPARGLYKTKVKCTNDTTGSWDYNEWDLKLNNITEETKCNLEFTSNLSPEEYSELLEAGVNKRRNTYRGKDITYLYNNKELYTQISNCSFDDIYVGDYIKTDKDGHNITWLIADLNNYLHSGYEDLKECHATIIPAIPLEDDRMNDSNSTGIAYKNSELTTKDGNTRTNIASYVGSKMKQETLPSIFETYIKPVFGDNIIEYTNLLADQYDGSRSNQFGTSSGYSVGASSGWAWYDSKLDLMSEVNVYGSTVWSSSGYDIGIDNRQYAIFKLKPEFINSYGTTRFHYWLKAVALSTGFAGVGDGGVADAYAASYSHGVRPRFLIK